MAVTQENIDFLFDVIKFYDEEYSKVADNCFEEINRALNEISKNYLKSQKLTIMPYGVYALKNNYQMLEPMEFYCIMPADRSILEKERLQKQNAMQKKKKGVKDIYRDIVGESSKAPKTAIDVAGIIMRELQRYVDEEDKVYFKNNVVFVKFKIQDEVELAINIYVVYDFEKNGILEFSKLGYKMKENSNSIMNNIQQKNKETKGNYLLLCKLIKMLELELILTNQSNVYLSNKSLFVENILYNIPNKFFQGEDFCEIFKTIVNYLKQCDVENMYLPDGLNQKMFSEYGYYTNKFFKSFIKKITYIYKNTDKLIQASIEEANKNQENNLDEYEEDIEESLDEPKEIQKINKNKE